MGLRARVGAEKAEIGVRRHDGVDARQLAADRLGDCRALRVEGRVARQVEDIPALREPRPGDVQDSSGTCVKKDTTSSV